MSTFTNTTVRVLSIGALVLGGGLFYLLHANQMLGEADRSLRRIDAAQGRADTTLDRVNQYNELIASMADKKIDRQEPFSVVSELSPEEIRKVADVLTVLYQRGGHFFLQRFHLAWQEDSMKSGAGTSVTLDLQGRKVLLFSDEATRTAAVADSER